MTEGSTTESATELDFALAAYREEGSWQVTPVPLRGDPDLASLVSSLRRYPSESGVIGMVSVADDFFLLARVLGGRARLLISDVTAATQWPLAREVVDELDIPMSDEDDEEVPAGDLAIVADLGMSAMDLGALCDDIDLYPDEMLGEIADKLGFGPQFREAVDSIG
jgi:putative tRNA adenosine deaminase-associated protein